MDEHDIIETDIKEIIDSEGNDEEEGVKMKDNDPRLGKAIAAKIARPGMSANDALIAGGFVLQGKSRKVVIKIQKNLSNRLWKIEQSSV